MDPTFNEGSRFQSTKRRVRAEAETSAKNHCIWACELCGYKFNKDHAKKCSACTHRAPVTLFGVTIDGRYMLCSVHGAKPPQKIDLMRCLDVQSEVILESVLDGTPEVPLPTRMIRTLIREIGRNQAVRDQIVTKLKCALNIGYVLPSDVADAHENAAILADKLLHFDYGQDEQLDEADGTDDADNDEMGQSFESSDNQYDKTSRSSTHEGKRRPSESRSRQNTHEGKRTSMIEKKGSRGGDGTASNPGSPNRLAGLGVSTKDLGSVATESPQPQVRRPSLTKKPSAASLPSSLSPPPAAAALSPAPSAAGASVLPPAAAGQSPAGTAGGSRQNSATKGRKKKRHKERTGPLDLFQQVMESGKQLVYDPNIGQFREKKELKQDGIDSSSLHGAIEDFNYVKFMKRERQAMNYKLGILIQEASVGAVKIKSEDDIEKEALRGSSVLAANLRKPCALCERIFRPWNLPGVVPFKAIVDWRQGHQSPIEPTDRRLAQSRIYEPVRLCLFCTQFFDAEFSDYVEYHLSTTDIHDSALELEDLTGHDNELDPGVTKKLRDYADKGTISELIRPTSAFLQEMELDALRDKRFLPKLMSNMGNNLARATRPENAKVQLFSPTTSHGGLGSSIRKKKAQMLLTNKAARADPLLAPQGALSKSMPLLAPISAKAAADADADGERGGEMTREEYEEHMMKVRAKQRAEAKKAREAQAAEEAAHKKLPPLEKLQNKPDLSTDKKIEEFIFDENRGKKKGKKKDAAAAAAAGKQQLAAEGVTEYKAYKESMKKAKSVYV